MATTDFPPLSPAYILAFQFSAWYPIFSSDSIKSTIIRPLDPAFRDYLDADGVFVPAGAEDTPAESALSDDEGSDSDDDDEEEAPKRHYAFPELDAQIRACIQDYGGVFPKLNFSSPQDAAWLLPASSPLKCTTPAEVYLLLKSSDFITHDLSPDAIFAGCESESGRMQSVEQAGDSSETASAEWPPYELELVLRKWYPVDRGRELRCFVRGDRLIAISQRDTNFYEFWNEPGTQRAVARDVQRFWRTKIQPRWPARKDYVFDILLTRDLARGHIVDFNPYHPKTDPLLFSYDELSELYLAADIAAVHIQDGEASDDVPLPVFRVIDSASHPAANRNAPAHQHNMIPFEAASLSSGRDIEEFADMWKDEVKKSMGEGDD